MACQEKWVAWFDKINFDKLRKNQNEAISETKRFLESNDIRYRIEKGGKIKIYCESTGSGKTLLILIVGMLLCSKIKKENGEQSRILIVNPTRVIRDVNKGALDDALSYGIIPEDVYKEIKIESLDKDSSIGHIKNSDIIITTYQKLGANNRNLIKELPKYVDIVLIDEGHHAYDDEEDRNTTHQDILKYFNDCYKLLFTATPYKSMPRKEQETGLMKLSSLFNNFDNQCDVIHDFSYGDSWKSGYAKFPQLKGISLNKMSLIQTSVTGEQEVENYEIEGIDDYKEILKKINKSDYVQHSKAVELMLKTVLSFVDKKNKDLRNNVHNAGLVVFRTKKEAINAGEILSKISDKKFVIVYGGKPTLQKDRDDIQNDVYDIILGVDLLKEGFNYHNISVIGISRNIKSFSYFIQLLGRAARARKDKYGNKIPVIGTKEIMWDVSYVIYHEIQDQIKKYWDLFSKYDWKEITEEEIKKIEDKIDGGGGGGGERVDSLYYIEDVSLEKISTDSFDEKVGRPEDELNAEFMLKAMEKNGKDIIKISDNYNRSEICDILIKIMDEVHTLKIIGRSKDDIEEIDEDGYKSLIIHPSNKKMSISDQSIDNVNKANNFLWSQISKFTKQYKDDDGYTIQHCWTMNQSMFYSAVTFAWQDIYGYRLRGTSNKNYKITEEISNKLINHLPKEIEKYKKNPNLLKYKFIPKLVKRIKRFEKNKIKFEDLENES